VRVPHAHRGDTPTPWNGSQLDAVLAEVSPCAAFEESVDAYWGATRPDEHLHEVRRVAVQWFRALFVADTETTGGVVVRAVRAELRGTVDDLRVCVGLLLE
jgi:hypothetical protein